MRGHVLKFATTLLVSASAGCVRTAPTPLPTYPVSSDSSQYSPNVQLRVATARDGATTLAVFLDSGVIAVPGAFTPESPVMMRDLYVTGYVATSNPIPTGLARGDPARFADRRGWRAIAESDSMLLVEQLRFGERRAIRPVRLQVRDAPSGDGTYWLVLGISGQSVDLRIPFDENGGLRAGAPGGRRLQVYACSDRDLNGQVDTARSNAMRRAYGLAC